MPRPLLLDTTAFIPALRNPDRHIALRRLVVRPRRQQAAITQLLAPFARLDRLLVPTEEEWVAAGRLIAHARWRHGDMEPRDHYTDALIAHVAARIGATIVTAIAPDFRHWVTLGRLNVTVRADIQSV
jgi:predicted nucleic acid-binding protein